MNIQNTHSRPTLKSPFTPQVGGKPISFPVRTKKYGTHPLLVQIKSLAELRSQSFEKYALGQMKNESDSSYELRVQLAGEAILKLSQNIYKHMLEIGRTPIAGGLPDNNTPSTDDITWVNRLIKTYSLYLTADDLARVTVRRKDSQSLDDSQDDFEEDY